MRNENAGKAIYRILNYMGYSDYLNEHGMDQGKTEILQLLGDQESDLLNFLPHLKNLREMISKRSGDQDSKLILSTIHSSKGLEYDRVYMIDMMNGILPSMPDPDHRKNAELSEIAMYEEERRLYYVGMTRAKNELDIFSFGDIDTSSFTKRVFGIIEPDNSFGKRSAGISNKSFPAKNTAKKYKSTLKNRSDYKKIRTDYSGKKQ